MTGFEQTLQISKDISSINSAARTARRICTDIIRQTSTKPYYHKIGAAALYAHEDRSAAQLQRIQQALDHIAEANRLLVDIAIEGGTTQAQIHAMLREDYNFGKGQIVTIPDSPEDAENTPSISEKTTLQK